MLRASLAALGVAMLLLWVVGVADGSTIWLTWLDGIAGVLTFLAIPVVRDETGPIGAATVPALLGLGLVAMFVIGLGTHASGWLTWFTLAFGIGYLGFAAFAFAERAVRPHLESRRPLSAL